MAFVTGDPGRMRQILVNLTSNAVKFTANGTVCIELVVIERNDERVSIRCAVRDTGIGIPADRMSALFQPFSQVDSSTTRRFGGTGLGLSISGRLVELMGGAIEVASTIGAGSTFSFTLTFPIATGPTLAVPDSQEIAGHMPENRRILLAEDNVVNQKVASRLLENRMHLKLASGCLFFALAPAALLTSSASSFTAAKAVISGGANGITGNASFVEDGSGKVIVTITIKGPPSVLAPGRHGVHIHEVGTCDGPGFTTAGGHVDPGPDGNSNTITNHPFHLGDLENIKINRKGEGVLVDTTTSVTLSTGDRSVFDDNGSAIIIHALEDQQSCQPQFPGGPCMGVSGGPRLACGVIKLVE